MQKALSNSLRVFLVSFSVFVVHRWMTWDFLKPHNPLTTKEIIEAWGVGLMSDVWVATLFCLLSLIIGGVTGIWGKTKYLSLVFLFFAAFVSIGIFFHQSYVEFFGFQAIPFHFTYVLKPEFLVSSGSTALTSGSIATALFSIGVVYLLHRFWKLDQFTLKINLILFLTAMLVGLISHNRNIHYRVQWFVPEKLQVNVVEKLYLNFLAIKPAAEVTSLEMRFLAKQWGGEKTLSSLFLTDPSLRVSPLGKAIKTEVKAAEKPLILVILMESLRPSESGLYYTNKKSLTPNLDRLSLRGVSFQNAFSTGTVTRGAQEAVWCGYPGEISTSTMQGRVDVKLNCLPSQLKQKASTFWLHGGNPKFDSQLSFWQRQGVSFLTSQNDFDDDVARTGWGIGDVTLFNDSSSKIKMLHLSAKTPLLGMILSVSNHIPWNIPDDFSVDKVTGHGSYTTTLYSDEALGQFAKNLKNSGLWDNALIIITGDHGNLIPPWADIYPDKNNLSEKLSTHVPLVVVGGIIEKVVKTKKLIREHKSQADVAPFFAYLFDLDSKFFGENLFSERVKPVISCLEQRVFAPKTGVSISKARALAADTSTMSSKEKVVALSYRSIINLINNLEQKKGGSTPP